RTTSTILLGEMRKRGGKALREMGDPDLTDILKDWGFEPARTGRARGWAAPPLGELRADLSATYPAIVWDLDELVPEWRADETDYERHYGKRADDSSRSSGMNPAPPTSGARRGGGHDHTPF